MGDVDGMKRLVPGGQAMKEMTEKYPQEKNPYITKEMCTFLSNRVAEEFVLSF
jgi:hypothetical protein